MGLNIRETVYGNSVCDLLVSCWRNIVVKTGGAMENENIVFWLETWKYSAAKVTSVCFNLE
jgi:hypothetical protein